MAAGVLEDAELREAQRDYLNFLDDEVHVFLVLRTPELDTALEVEDQGVYHSKVRDMISDNRYRLLININDLRRKNEKRANRLLTNAFEELIAFQRALKDFVASVDTTYAKQYEDFYIGLEGSFGSKHVSPWTLTACFLSCIVCVEGIMTKCSLVRPKVVQSVHYCPATKKTIERRYTDMTSLDAFPSSSVYPTKDEENNPLETEFGLSVYKDHQTITIQEMPEKAPAGQLPRSVDVVLDDDLVDKVKPGDRIQVVGTYHCLPGKKGGYTSGTFRGRPLGFWSKGYKGSEANYTVTEKEILAAYEGVRAASEILENGSRIRGDINVLLIGDPSVAKSQLLRYVLHTAPRAIPTTGRVSSGVGLTAAVTTDQETGERHLEAGAMVLADRGVVCIDEFDKMSDIDRTAIHEVMEQGCVTISKAGIHARLNSRCSVLAAANPVYGWYDQYKTPMENIGLQDSLLSCFDLLFIVLDQMDPEQDREISDHVLHVHCYRNPNEQDGDAMPLGSAVEILATDDPDFAQEEEQELQVYEKHDDLLHGPHRCKEKVVSMEFMRKYIHVAKMIKPVLTQESASYIAEEYSCLRSQSEMNSDVARTSPITARTLETLIRLSTAHAKARMNKTVDLQDAEAAVELVQFAYFKKVLEREKKRKKRTEDDSETEKEEDEQSQPTEEHRMRTRKKACTEGEGDSYDPYDFSDAEEEMPEVQAHTPKTPEASAAGEEKTTELAEPRLKTFKAALLEVFKTSHAQSVGLKNVMESINCDNPEPFSLAEVSQWLSISTPRSLSVWELSSHSDPKVKMALAHMQDDNQIMVSDDIVFLI
ncbi:DNA replication licensing factor MCM3 [Melanerpes formicivorus]|uniref:DNA replication licensing factor MCM3 n=1 Tax=Melanerpes formicivorus TaxID=211600 RepID=UPI00358F0B55